MRASCLLLLTLTLCSCAHRTERISVSDIGRYDFSLPGYSLDGLSGITYAGDNQYWVASDASASLHLLEIDLDPVSGRIQSVRVRREVQLENAQGLPLIEDELKDREDLAISADGARAWIVNERCGATPPRTCIDVHELATGRLVNRLGVDAGGPLQVFGNAESNRGFEAITTKPNGGIWVATERALPIDGAPATSMLGSPIRLQLLDGELNGIAQYVYVTDRIERPIASPESLVRHSGSRIVGLFTLPDDTLVALENTFQGNAAGLPACRILLYELDVSAATDVQGAEFSTGLQGKTFVPVKKRRLIELAFDGVDANYEGVALGPKLSSGDYAVVLIRDNGQGESQSLHTLRLHFASADGLPVIPAAHRSHGDY